jgi:hypothetical protein
LVCCRDVHVVRVWAGSGTLSWAACLHWPLLGLALLTHSGADAIEILDADDVRHVDGDSFRHFCRLCDALSKCRFVSADSREVGRPHIHCDRDAKWTGRTPLANAGRALDKHRRGFPFHRMDWRRSGTRMVGCLESASRSQAKISCSPEHATATFRRIGRRLCVDRYDSR